MQGGCRGGSPDESLRVLTPADVIHRVLEPLRQRRACSAAYLQALASLFGMAAKAQSLRLPVANDIFLLDCILDQVRMRYCIAAGVLVESSQHLLCRTSAV